MTTYDDALLEKAHKHSISNQELLMRSETAGCFFCCEPVEIAAIKWHEEKRGEVAGTATALCPKCGIDSVLPSAAGVPVDEDFLNEMHKRWFW